MRLERIEVRTAYLESGQNRLYFVRNGTGEDGYIAHTETPASADSVICRSYVYSGSDAVLYENPHILGWYPNNGTRTPETPFRIAAALAKALDG